MNENMMRIMKTGALVGALVAGGLCFGFASSVVYAEEVKDAAGREGIYKEDGRYFNKDDNPTYFYEMKKDERSGKEVKVWDWLTYNGNRRYHAECHVCHGPHGLGSSFAPNLYESLKTMSYEDFREVVVNGRSRDSGGGTKNIMPKFGNNENVMCYLDDFYVYLLARAKEELPALTIQQMKKEKKPKEVKEDEYACFGYE